MNGVFAASRRPPASPTATCRPATCRSTRSTIPDNARPRLTGYQASNSITIKVRKLDTLGKTLDAVVKGGGNTINGISFSVDQPDKFQNEARVEAIKDAAAKAETLCPGRRLQGEAHRHHQRAGILSAAAHARHDAHAGHGRSSTRPNRSGRLSRWSRRSMWCSNSRSRLTHRKIPPLSRRWRETLSERDLMSGGRGI